MAPDSCVPALLELQTIFREDFTNTLALARFTDTLDFWLCSDDAAKLKTKHFSAGQESNITRAVFFCAMSYVFSSFINILAELRFYAARRAVSCECKVQNV